MRSCAQVWTRCPRARLSSRGEKYSCPRSSRKHLSMPKPFDSLLDVSELACSKSSADWRRHHDRACVYGRDAAIRGRGFRAAECGGLCRAAKRAPGTAEGMGDGSLDALGRTGPGASVMRVGGDQHAERFLGTT